MFRDTSMDYLSRDEVLEIWNNNMRLTDEQLLAMDETEFRARVRERSHHTLEIQVYATAYRHQKLKPNQADYTKHLLELWSSFHTFTRFTFIRVFARDNHILVISVFMQFIFLCI